MALSTKLELRQSQQLVMTPQLQQAIKLLQLSNLELSTFVDAELERNPLLEREEQLREAPAPVESSGDGDAEPAVAGLDQALAQGAPSRELDSDLENVYPDTPRNELGGEPSLGSWTSVGQRGGSTSFDDDSNIEDRFASDLTLKDHLTAQLNLALTSPVERLIGANLIDLTDEGGYLRADLAEVASRLGASVEHVERVLSVLQTFDPAGVFARDLRECLTLQLKDAKRYDPMIARLLDSLPLLAARNFPALKRAVECDQEDLTDMIAEIKRLNPKPGLGFGRADVEAVVPDVQVRAASDGSWIVELNSETLPRVLVSRVYYARVSRTATTEKDKDFLLDCLQSANWLVKSLDQRARTILRVAQEIVRQQDGFLMNGVQYLRPLNLKTVADAIKMHESTVSRVTSNKYIATPRGIFEFKYFFTSAIASAGEGEAHSSEAVRFRIKSLIDAEGSDSVLSDDKLVEILGQEGVEIARRTVAKYRESMRIPSSVQRRRDKRMMEDA